MAELMEEALLIGSFDAGKMEFKAVSLDLGTFVRRLADEVLSATDRRCPIELSLADVPAEFRADERLLRHIFTNLLTNAVKYSDIGRVVNSRRTASHRLEWTCSSDVPWLLFPPKQLPKAGSHASPTKGHGIQSNRAHKSGTRFGLSLLYLSKS
jgi:hypothetical protein